MKVNLFTSAKSSSQDAIKESKTFNLLWPILEIKIRISNLPCIAFAVHQISSPVVEQPPASGISRPSAYQYTASSHRPYSRHAGSGPNLLNPKRQPNMKVPFFPQANINTLQVAQMIAKFIQKLAKAVHLPPIHPHNHKNQFRPFKIRATLSLRHLCNIALLKFSSCVGDSWPQHPIESIHPPR